MKQGGEPGHAPAGRVEVGGQPLCQKDSLGGLGTCSREPRAEDGCMRCLGAGLAVHAGVCGGNVGAG